MKLEYLVVTRQDGSFCNNKGAFDSLLQANSQIRITKNKLTFTNESGSLEVEYSLETEEIKGKGQRYFHIKLNMKDSSQIELFTSLTRAIRKVAEKLHDNVSINTLWDDVSRHYIAQGYPLINEIENLMRKLILKFMIVNVGMEWLNEAAPSDLKQKIAKKSDTNKSTHFLEDTLHNADFIQLSGFLFDKYRTKEISVLDDMLSNKDKAESVNTEELRKNFLPMSNWDRYFSTQIKYEGKLLEGKWAELYNLRNKIAHNKTFSKQELEKVEKITKDINAKLDEAIAKLDNVVLDEEQKENIVTSYIPHHRTFIGYAATNSKNSNIAFSKRISLKRFVDAVAEWYTLQDGFSVTRHEYNYHDVDLTVLNTKNQQRVGVIVKLTQSSNTAMLAYMINESNDISFLPHKDNFDEFHLVIVFMNNPDSSDDSPTFSSTIYELHEAIKSGVKLIIGYLDSDLKFKEIAAS